MINFLDLLGIHEWDIEVTERRIRDAFEDLYLDAPADLAERTVQLLCEREITEDLGNQIIDCILNAAAGALEDMVAPFKPAIELFCNGADSRFSLLYESDKDIIRAAKTNPNLDIEFIAWLRDEITDTDDFMDVIKNDMLCEALMTLRDASGSLVWSYPGEEYSDEEIPSKEQECLDNPEDINKIFFMVPSGKIWEAKVAS